MPIQLQKLNIHNFKSWVDLTLELKKLTVFVGDKEFGKSSLIEAISFVTGEQDLQKLRVSNLQELVHQDIADENGEYAIEFDLKF